MPIRSPTSGSPSFNSGLVVTVAPDRQWPNSTDFAYHSIEFHSVKRGENCSADFFGHTGFHVLAESTRGGVMASGPTFDGDLQKVCFETPRGTD